VVLKLQAELFQNAPKLSLQLPEDRPALLELGFLLPPFLGPSQPAHEGELFLEVVEKPLALDLRICLSAASRLPLPWLLRIPLTCQRKAAALRTAGPDPFELAISVQREELATVDADLALSAAMLQAEPALLQKPAIQLDGCLEGFLCIFVDVGA
jgi:hypothetical protein